MLSFWEEKEYLGFWFFLKRFCKQYTYIRICRLPRHPPVQPLEPISQLNYLLLHRFHELGSSKVHCATAPKMLPDYTPIVVSIQCWEPFGKLLNFCHTTKAPIRVLVQGPWYRRTQTPRHFLLSHESSTHPLVSTMAWKCKPPLQDSILSS